jgi:hypothetical protein
MDRKKFRTGRTRLVDRRKRIAALVLSALLALAVLTGCAKRQITASVPGDGKSISTANNIVAGFCKNYTPGISEELREYKDMYFPAGIDLKWEYGFESGDEGEGEGASPLYAYVYFSDNKDLSDGRSYITAGNSVHVDDLLVNKDYYWQVEAVFKDHTVKSSVFKLHTSHDFRTFNIPNVSNTRDLGGYDTIYKKVVRQGMIFRGANVDAVKAASKKIMLDDLGIRTDLDLRAPGEGKAGGEQSPLGESVNYINISAPLYLNIKEESWQEALASEIRVFTDRENYPVYFHCAIGRDRTGTLAMLLLGLLGVPENMIRRDYEMSFLSYSGSADKTPVETMLSANFEPTVKYLKTFSGKTFADNVVNYLKSIGITQEEIDAIRDIMLE